MFSTGLVLINYEPKMCLMARDADFGVCRLEPASAYLKVQLSDIEGEDTGLQKGQSLESNC